MKSRKRTRIQKKIVFADLCFITTNYHKQEYNPIEKDELQTRTKPQSC